MTPALSGMTGGGLVDLREAASRLGVHYMTAYRYVRTGRLPAVQVRGRWWVDPDDLRLVVRTVPAEQTDVVATPERLSARLLAGDDVGARRIVESAVVSGRAPARAVLDLLVPAMRLIGDGWESGALSVGQEHQATAVATRLLAGLHPMFTRPGRKRGSVVLACVAGEQHALPLAVVATVLRGEGYGVVELGADTPARAVVELAGAAGRLLAVGLSASTPATFPAAAAAVSAVRAAGVPAPVLVGGGAVRHRDQALELGADDWAPDAAALVTWLGTAGGATPRRARS